MELATKLVWDVVEGPGGEPADCVLLEVMLAVYFSTGDFGIRSEFLSLYGGCGIGSEF